MSKIKRTSLPWTTVYAHGTGVVALAASAWMTASEAAKVRGTFEVAGRDGDIEVAIGFQVANVEDNVTTPQNPAITAYKAANGMQYPADFIDILPETKSKQLVRWVWLVKNTSTSNLTFARVGGLVDVEEC